MPVGQFLELRGFYSKAVISGQFWDILVILNSMSVSDEVINKAQRQRSENQFALITYLPCTSVIKKGVRDATSLSGQSSGELSARKVFLAIPLRSTPIETVILYIE